jgi:hypothetical protein
MVIHVNACSTRDLGAGAFFVVCIDPSGLEASLEKHKIYTALQDEEAAANGDLRVIDESGEAYLYSAERFVSIDVPDEVGISLLGR